MKLVKSNSPLLVCKAWHGTVNASAVCDLRDDTTEAGAAATDPVLRVYGDSVLTATIRAVQVSTAVNLFGDLCRELKEMTDPRNAMGSATTATAI